MSTPGLRSAAGVAKRKKGRDKVRRGDTLAACAPPAPLPRRHAGWL